MNHGWHRYIFKRLLLFIPTLILASLVVFVVMRALPGDVTAAILGGEGEALDPAIVGALRKELGLDDPLYVQYARWAWSMASGELGGRSLATGEPLTQLVARQLPITIQLTLYTLTIAILIAVPLGTAAAARHNRWPDTAVRIVSVLGSAVPGFWVALLALLGLVYGLRWYPPLVYIPFTESPGEHLQLMALPALVLGWGYGAHLARITRAQTIEALGQDYVRTARAKGVSGAGVLVRHALRTALIPVVTAAGLNIGGLLSGAAVLENLFGIPGMGRGIVQAVIARDYPVVQSLAVITVFVVLAVNLMIDLIYAYLDPRVSLDD